MNLRHALKTMLAGFMAATLACCSSGLNRDARELAGIREVKVLVIGHRGAAGLAPENTLAAFQAALELGVDALEMDVQLTRDGKLVVYHDLTLKPEITRRPDGKWLDGWTRAAVKDLSLAELKRYDVGRLASYTIYARRYPDQIPADGETIPTLPAVINLAKSYGNRVELWIEIKTSPLAPRVSSNPNDVAEAVIHLLRRTHYTHRAKILSFDWRALARVQRMDPDAATVYLTNTSSRMDTIRKGQAGPSPWTAGLDIDDHSGSIPALVAAAGGRFWAPRHNQLSPEDLAEARHHNIQVHVWTPDSASDLRRCIRIGVDGIITNQPDRLLALLGRIATPGNPAASPDNREDGPQWSRGAVQRRLSAGPIRNTHDSQWRNRLIPRTLVDPIAATLATGSKRFYRLGANYWGVASAAILAARRGRANRRCCRTVSSSERHRFQTPKMGATDKGGTR